MNIQDVIRTINQMEADGVINGGRVRHHRRLASSVSSSYRDAHHRELASRPVAEKLRMLDALRERELAIRSRCLIRR